MLIAFHTPNLNFRGSCVALMDYALYNETLLENKSIIITDYNQRSTSDNIAFKWVTNRFPLYQYKTIEDLENILCSKKVDILYCIKYGTNDGVYSKKVKTLVHCVFDMSDPHGNVYVGVSKSLANKFGYKTYIPHMITTKYSDGKNLRDVLNIPSDAIVFGRHGGIDTFNLQWAKDVFSKIVRCRPDVYFIFLNAEKWDSHQNIKILDPTTDVEYKKMFIRTLDCGLCPESMGHTFGLAIGEICAFNKPVMIYNGNVWNRAHIDIMGDIGIYFDNPDSLYTLIMEFNPSDYISRDNNAYKEFTPEKVMALFNKNLPV